MTAPESVVRAVQEALGCVRGDTTGRCLRHARAWHPAYPCPAAQATADAAWVASLRHVRDRLPGPEAQRQLIEGDLTGWAASAIARSVRHQVTRMMADGQERGES